MTQNHLFSHFIIPKQKNYFREKSGPIYFDLACLLILNTLSQIIQPLLDIQFTVHSIDSVARGRNNFRNNFLETFVVS
jgi:hypothetical protein